MPQPGTRNLITDVNGITVGNATDEDVQTGVTVLRCEQSFISAVDVRGGAPGVRETDTLSPENLVGRTDAIVLTGGSVFGLAAADGVTNYLSENGIGLRLSPKGPAIPIVPSAVLHDLANDGNKDWGSTPPYHALGREAAENTDAAFALGNVGAGRGAMAGIQKGGLGSCSLDLGDGLIVGALVAANPIGSVMVNGGKTFFAGPHELNNEFGGYPPAAKEDLSDPFPDLSRLGFRAQGGSNTTLVIVASTADLSGVEAKRVAMMAQDGLARAIRPAHTPFDGDIVFAVATASVSLPEEPMVRPIKVAEIGAASADCVARAIARAVYEAQS